jgi:hypothetical protein
VAGHTPLVRPSHTAGPPQDVTAAFVWLYLSTSLNPPAAKSCASSSACSSGVLSHDAPAALKHDGELIPGALPVHEPQHALLVCLKFHTEPLA